MGEKMHTEHFAGWVFSLSLIQDFVFVKVGISIRPMWGLVISRSFNMSITIPFLGMPVTKSFRVQ